jgi:hypothetical protein
MHQILGLGNNGVQVRLVWKTFRVGLVHVFRLGRPDGEPAAGGHDFQAADAGLVPRSAGQPGGDRLASQGRRLDGRRIGPSLSVVHTVPPCRRKLATSTLLAAEAARAVQQAGHEPLKAHRHLITGCAPR